MTSSPAGRPGTATLGTVATVPLPEGLQAHRLSAAGPLVAFDEIGFGTDVHGLGTRIHLADLQQGTMTTFAETGNGDAAWVPDVTPGAVAWAEWHYDHEGSGALAWKVVVQRVGDGNKIVIASGTNRRLEGNAAVPPLVQIDGDHVAYTIEDATRDRPFGWQVLVVSRESGKVIDRYSTKLSIYQMALDDEAILYTEGIVDEQRSFKYATHLMLATPDVPDGAELATDAFEVALADGRAAWISDPASSEGQLGMAQDPEIVTARVAAPNADILSDETGYKGAYWPATAEDFVAWSEDEGSSDGIGANRLALWDAAHGTRLVGDAHTPFAMLGGQGWLSWYDDSAEGINAVLHGTRLADITYP